MPSTPRLPTTKAHPRIAIAAALALFVLFVIAAEGYLVWSAGVLDDEARSDQNARIARAIGRQLSVVAHNQESVAIWDDAVIAARNGDTDWFASNIGTWMHDYFRHDESYVVAADGRPIYASVEGETVAATQFLRREPVVKPIIADTSAIVQAAAAGTPPHVSDYALVDGKPAIVSVMKIVPDTPAVMAPPGSEPMLVSIISLDRAREDNIIEEFRSQPGQFATANVALDQVALPILDRNGRIIAQYEWTPDRPGNDLLGRALPIITATIIAIGGLFILTLFRLWRSSQALETQSRTAERMANEDALTGLPNRLCFEQRFGAMLARPAGSDKRWLYMLDLDRFKHVNDTFGHAAGDELIRAVAGRIGLLLGPNDLLARLGGDEFAILGHGDTDRMSRLGDAIIAAISRPFRIHETDMFVGVSIGAVRISGSAGDYRELARKADIALYEAKSAGRNRMALYHEAMDEAVQNRHRIEAELRDALRGGGQLWLAFQPLYAAPDLRLCGAEALVRWSHPRLGNVPPGQFVPIAESAGLIDQLGRFILRGACEMGARWPGMTIAVNVSPAQLRDTGFAAEVLSILSQTGMRPTDLEVEITEGILLDDEEHATATIRTLRHAGIRVALDDFGTGYSSLGYLRRYPVDRIKIDRSFISMLGNDEKANAIVQAMIALPHALDIAVTAEGVESTQQRDLLLAFGCNTLQGYLLASPVPASRMQAIFTDRAPSPRAVA